MLTLEFSLFLEGVSRFYYGKGAEGNGETPSGKVDTSRVTSCFYRLKNFFKREIKLIIFLFLKNKSLMVTRCVSSLKEVVVFYKAMHLGSLLSYEDVPSHVSWRRAPTFLRSVSS